MPVCMNISQGDTVFENAKLLPRRACVSLDRGVAKQQHRLRCNTLPQEMKVMSLLYHSILGDFVSPNFSFIVYVQMIQGGLQIF